MELKCPSCFTILNTAGGSIPRACPACGAVIEVLEHGERLTLLSAKKQNDGQAIEDTASAAYEKWRVRAVFIALLGFTFFFFTFLDLKNSYVNYGHFFWKNPQNLIFPLIAGVLAAFFMLAGCWLFRYVGKKKKEYETINNNKGEWAGEKN